MCVLSYPAFIFAVCFCTSFVLVYMRKGPVYSIYVYLFDVAQNTNKTHIITSLSKGLAGLKITTFSPSASAHFEKAASIPHRTKTHVVRTTPKQNTPMATLYNSFCIFIYLHFTWLHPKITLTTTLIPVTCSKPKMCICACSDFSPY